MLAEFDRHAGSYEESVDDPIRTRFQGSQSDFFHRRKRDLIREYFGQDRNSTRAMRYLDLGCGKGDLASLLVGDFGAVSGCDPSAEMLASATRVETRVQGDPGVIPFDDGSFDFVTAVCVYHHVPVAARLNLTREVRRVLSPGGRFCIIEHNPFNPVTRLIVSRTPIDSAAVLLRPSETCSLMKEAGFTVERPRFFLYVPERLYSAIGCVERVLARVPAGGQFAVFGTAP